MADSDLRRLYREQAPRAPEGLQPRPQGVRVDAVGDEGDVENAAAVAGEDGLVEARFHVSEEKKLKSEL